MGLNIQAASVVVLCEPQLTPAAEDQAIARVHRMGQVRTVRVHRLLEPDGVDERIRELLAVKRRTFDDYVRESSVAAGALAAVDVSRRDLARQVVAAEQARLGYGAGVGRAGAGRIAGPASRVRRPAGRRTPGVQETSGSLQRAVLPSWSEAGPLARTAWPLADGRPSS